MIVKPSDVLQHARFMSTHLDDAKVTPFIEESELSEVRAALGDELYLNLDEYVTNNRTPVNEAYNNILDGCTYENRSQKHLVIGLVKAISYLTYARLVKSGDIFVTRSGNKLKLDANSETPDLKERIVAYQDTFKVANDYLATIVGYVQFAITGKCGSSAKLYPKSVTITAIGD